MEKKEKNIKKVTTKTKENKIKTESDNITVSDEKKLVKFISLLITFFASALAIIIFVFSIIASISIANLPKEELVNNNIVVTLISKLNNYSISEVKGLINTLSSRFSFIVFEIIIPTIAFIGAMLLLIALSKRLIDFISDVKFKNDIFTDKKVNNLKDIISILSLVLLTTLVLFNEPSIIFYLIIELLLCATFILFKKCVLLKKDNH